MSIACESDDFLEWLSEIGISKYCQAFKDNDYDSPNIVNAFNPTQVDHMIKVVGCTEGAGIKIKYYFSQMAEKKLKEIAEMKIKEEKRKACFKKYWALSDEIPEKKIFIRKNDLSDETVLIISEWMQSNTTTTYLEMSQAKIGNNGALALAEMLRANTTLQVLRLEENDITEFGAFALVKASSSNLRVLGLNLNRICWRQVDKIRELAEPTRVEGANWRPKLS